MEKNMKPLETDSAPIFIERKTFLLGEEDRPCPFLSLMNSSATYQSAIG